jgi:Tat protein secretion system quality control protein TatD with DNase activity
MVSRAIAAIAEVKGLTGEEVEIATSTNAAKLFALNKVKR